MAFSFAEILPAAAQVASTLVSNRAVNKASDAYTASTQRAANELLGGYDRQLAALQQGYDYLRGLAGGQLEDVTNQGNLAVDQYGREIRTGLTDYENTITPFFSNYAEDVGDNSRQYGNAMEGVSSEAQQPFQGYVQGGEEAQAYLQSILATDPSQLTASQLKTYEDIKRGVLGSLAASGLRGAGRAGVYSAGAALSDARNRMEESNRQRMDNAATALATRGYSAAGNVSGIRQNLGKDIASNAYNAGNDIASKGYALGADIAGKGFKVNADIAGKGYAQGNQTAQNIADMYGNLSNIENSRTSAVAGTELKKADVQSQNIGSQAQTSYSNTRSAGENTANLIGRLAATTADIAKKDQAQSANSNTINGRA